MTIHADDAAGMENIEELFLLKGEIQRAIESAYTTGRLRGKIEGVEDSVKSMGEIVDRLMEKA